MEFVNALWAKVQADPVSFATVLAVGVVLGAILF